MKKYMIAAGISAALLESTIVSANCKVKATVINNTGKLLNIREVKWQKNAP